MTPCAGLAEGMGNLSLIELDQPWLLPAYQLPSLSLRLALDEGWPLPVLHPSLLLPAMTPPSSLTPTNSSPNPFRVKRQMFQAAQGPDGLIWTEEERAALQAFLSHYTSEEGVNVPILEVGEGDRSPGGSRMLSEGAGFGEGGIGA